MTETSANQPPLPAGIEQRLKAFCGDLRGAAGDRVSSVLLYGGLARGEYIEHRSDVNVLIVLRDAGPEALDFIRGPVRRAAAEFGLAAMVVTAEDIRRSADVFPIKFLDIKRHHVILFGVSLFEDLEISRDHLRLSCEQELKNLLIRLRRAYLMRGDRPEMVEITLSEALSSFLTSVAALVTLKTGTTPAGKPATIEAASREFGLGAATLSEVLALKAGDIQPDAKELNALFGRFMAVVERAAQLVDRYAG